MGLLGIAKKAGMVVSGAENVWDAARTGKIKLVLLSEDASENTKKRVINFCKYYNKKLCTLPLTKEEIGKAIGLNVTAVIGITDKGISEAIIKNTGVGI